MCYYPSGQSFAVFYNGEQHSSLGGLIKLGEITSNLSGFENIDDSIEMTIDLVN
ncbi:cyclophilin-like fold protein [Enterococcus sp. AZ109]|uniref:cyclophilin-like fold protein n=1 Tax=Enterococcus sp. AZ109 TaxID=2774634 RepID=UPI003F6868A2